MLLELDIIVDSSGFFFVCFVGKNQTYKNLEQIWIGAIEKKERKRIYNFSFSTKLSNFLIRSIWVFFLSASSKQKLLAISLCQRVVERLRANQQKVCKLLLCLNAKATSFSKQFVYCFLFFFVCAVASGNPRLEKLKAA